MNTGSTNIRDDIDVMAITIIIIGDTIPAFTAASPRIKAPTIEMAEEAKLGSFKSLSLKTSHISKSINNDSNEIDEKISKQDAMTLVNTLKAEGFSDENIEKSLAKYQVKKAEELTEAQYAEILLKLNKK